MFFASKRPLVAIDIGSYSIKLVQLKKLSDGYELLNMGMIQLPPDTMIDGEIENPEAVSLALQNLVKAEKLKNKNIVMSISGQSVIIKKISVPEMSEEELAEMIREEAEQYIPFDIDEVNLDFQIVKQEEPEIEPGAPDEPDEEEKQMDVLIVAARKDTIQVLNDVVKNVGMNLRVLDLDVFALENTYELNYEHEKDKAIALVNIGGSMTNVNILEAGITAFTRDIPVGGNNISEEIQKKLSVGYMDAEKLKLGILSGGVERQDIIPAALDGIDEIVYDLQKTFDLYEKTADFKITKIYIGGGSSQMEGIDKVLSEKLNLEVQILKTFKNIKIDEKVFDPEYVSKMEPVMALPVGLALRMLGDK